MAQKSNGDKGVTNAEMISYLRKWIHGLPWFSKVIISMALSYLVFFDPLPGSVDNILVILIGLMAAYFKEQKK
ncbi:hypothetical protein C4561_01070 [candidate division WWE3 bacterium]|jgi:hypothetical protein|uniref:Uncharacterized protein n=1 Tax=candidate division WWE3 bacterium TaxID=2053526 RepID=A0A3A4ZFP3_UNCKA|nr:MAG: hypothetical protein C4561_01070 [candidate division WWE3 bacterium]